MTAVSVEASIRAAGRDAWDALEGGTRLTGYAWLRTIEEHHDPDLRPVYFLAREGTDLVGATVAHRYRSTNEFFTPDHGLWRRYRKPAVAAGLSFLPALVCGPPKSSGGHFRCVPGLEAGDRGRITDLLLDSIEEAAWAEGAHVLFRDLTEEESDLVSRLRVRGYAITATPPFCRLDLRWDDFEGYVAAMRARSQNAANQIRKELRRARQAGVAIRRIENPASAAEALHRLIAGHHRRRNGKRLSYRPNFLADLARELGDDLVVFAAEHEGALTSCAIFLADGREAHSTFIALGEQREKAAYFPLGYYEPIRWAIETGKRSIDYGKLAYEAKLRRGCALRATALAFRSRHAVRNALARVWFRVGARTIFGNRRRAPTEIAG